MGPAATGRARAGTDHGPQRRRHPARRLLSASATLPVADPDTDRLLQAADAAQRAGRAAEAAALFARVLDRRPDHPGALNALGMQALGRQDAAEAAILFARAAAADPHAAPLWMNLANAHRLLGAHGAEGAALERALALDQRHLMANVRLAELHDRTGDRQGAAFRWGGVAAMLGVTADRTPALDELLAHAAARTAALGQAFGDTLDAALAPMRAAAPAAERRRIDACVDAMLGRRAIYANAPHGLHVPFLPADEFFARDLFPWMAALEAATPAIRAELESLLGAPDAGFAPYVEMTAGTPVNKWTPLDGSDAWSARYLWRYGVRDDAVCARCPATAAALAQVPLADMPGRAPTAFFSVLKPGTRLPAHTGVSNARAIVHLPLIVPEGCGFRVGGETRAWRVGAAFAFDDTIEHEAWNNSTHARAVLIFDVWNPHLAAGERAMLRALFETLGTLRGAPPAFGAVAD